MYIVFEDKSGDIKWDEIIEIESLEAFAKKMNKRAMEMGPKRPTYWVVPLSKIEVTEWDGKVKGTYRLCSDGKPCSLL